MPTLVGCTTALLKALLFQDLLDFIPLKNDEFSGVEQIGPQASTDQARFRLGNTFGIQFQNSNGGLLLRV